MLLQAGEVPIPELAGHLVAVLFAAAGPLMAGDAARVLDVSIDCLDEVCDFLQNEPPYGLALQRHAEQLQLITAPGSTAVVERYLGAPPPVRLSRAALEALAVIAYKQPVTRGEIDAVRGVNSDSAVSTLLTRSLVAEVGRRETVGRPALLAVTAECLQYLGIHSLDELPELPPRGDAPATVPSADAVSDAAAAAPPTIDDRDAAAAAEARVASDGVTAAADGDLGDDYGAAVAAADPGATDTAETTAEGKAPGSSSDESAERSTTERTDAST